MEKLIDMLLYLSISYFLLCDAYSMRQDIFDNMKIDNYGFNDMTYHKRDKRFNSGL